MQVWKEAAGQHMKCSCVYKHIFYLQNTLVHALAYLPNWTWSIYCNRLNSFTNIFQNIQTITNFTFQHPCLGNSEDQTMQISNNQLWKRMIFYFLLTQWDFGKEARISFSLKGQYRRNGCPITNYIGKLISHSENYQV